MRLLSMKEVQKLVPYSKTHLARLEAQKLFPRRVKLNPGLGPTLRVAYVEAEIHDWIKSRTHDASPSRRLIDTEKGPLMFRRG